MPLPEPKYFTIEMAAKRWDITIEEVINYAFNKQITIGTLESNTLGLKKIQAYNFDSIKNEYFGDFIHFKDSDPSLPVEKVDIKLLRISLKDIKAFETLETKPKTTELTTKHTSELLEYLSQLINEFWVDHDPKNPPTNDAMQAWLAEQDDRFHTKGNKDNPNQLAKYMAMITRPDKNK